MAECEGCAYSGRIDGGLDGATYSTDWFNSDSPTAKADAIRKFIRQWFKTKGGKKPEPCTGDCDDKTRACRPYAMFIEFPDGKRLGWFKKVATEVGDEVYESYVLRVEWGFPEVKVKTFCRCMKVDYY
jgi:hypothetical protein